MTIDPIINSRTRAVGGMTSSHGVTSVREEVVS